MDVSLQEMPYPPDNSDETSSTEDNEITQSVQVNLEDVGEEETTQTELPQISLNTKLAIAITRVLGPSDQIHELDMIRHQLKTGSNKSKNKTL